MAPRLGEAAWREEAASRIRAGKRAGFMGRVRSVGRGRIGGGQRRSLRLQAGEFFLGVEAVIGHRVDLGLRDHRASVDAASADIPELLLAGLHALIVGTKGGL